MCFCVHLPVLAAVTQTAYLRKIKLSKLHLIHLIRCEGEEMGNNLGTKKEFMLHVFCRAPLAFIIGHSMSYRAKNIDIWG